MICVQILRTAKLYTACAGILMSVDIRDVFAGKTTFHLTNKDANYVS